VQFLLDFIPIIAFFVAYKAYGIYIATTVAIALSFIHVCWKRISLKRFESTSLYTFLVIAVLGGSTLFFKNALFLKWKPTIVYWGMGLAFIVIPLIRHETLVQKMFQHLIQLPSNRWSVLNRCWVIFFMAMGVLNLYVAYNYNTDIWVNFKLFGSLGMTFLFLIGQGIFMAKYGTVLTGDAAHVPHNPKNRSHSCKD